MILKRIVYLCVLTSLVYAKSIDIPDDSCALVIPKRTISEVRNLVDFHPRPVSVYKTKNGGYTIVLGVLKLHAYKANIDRFQSMKVHSPDRYKMYRGAVCIKDEIFTEEAFVPLETISLKNSDDSVKKSASSSAVPLSKIKDFNSAIQAYDLKKDIAYLKKASSYADNDRRKAILERKLVGYLGADKVFKVDVGHSMGNMKTFSGAGLISYNKGSEKNVKMSIKISPRDNLPFKIEYNTYKIGLGIRADYERLQKQAGYDDKIHKHSERVYCSSSIILSKKNNWTYLDTRTASIVLYAKGAQFLKGKYSSKLINVELIPVITLAKQAAIKDDKSGLEWENGYSCNGGIAPQKKGWDSDRVAGYCKNLKGDSWRLPTAVELQSLAQNKALKNKLSINHSGLYWTSDRGYGVSLVNGSKKRLGLPSTNYIRCVRNANRVFQDNKTKILWQNTKIPGHNRFDEAKKYCRNLKLNGKGWRLPAQRELLDVYSRYSFQYDSKRDKYWTSTTNGSKKILTVDGITAQTGRSDSHSFWPLKARCVK